MKEQGTMSQLTIVNSNPLLLFLLPFIQLCQSGKYSCRKIMKNSYLAYVENGVL